MTKRNIVNFIITVFGVLLLIYLFLIFRESAGTADPFGIHLILYVGIIIIGIAAFSKLSKK